MLPHPYEKENHHCSVHYNIKKKEKIMIEVQNVTFGFLTKDLYKNISFTLEDGRHCAFIGSNGTGKTTLVDMIIHPDKYLYDGKIIKSEDCRMGYVNQFDGGEEEKAKTVFEFLSEDFVHNQKETEVICERMATEEDLEPLFEEYQKLLDLFQAMDGDNYESNIRKQLHMVGMSNHEDTKLGELSGGEYKLLQVMREMLHMPNLLIMDEPDVFLDFENMNGLCELINNYKGTLLVITHNRYLLNRCFDKILHLENADIQEFDGNYMEYRFALLEKKIELQEKAAADREEIERTEKMVERMRTNATIHSIASLGRAVHAKQTYLDRIRERAIKEPFLELRYPKITLPQIEADPEKTVLKVTDYKAAFDELLLEEVNFELKGTEKVAIVGANGTGKTTLFYDIFKNKQEAVEIPEDLEVGFLSQYYGGMWNEKNTVYEEFLHLGFENKEEVQEFLKDYYFDEEMLSERIEQLSGGEKNLLQLAKIALGKAELLLLDEPTSHLDTYAQEALERAIIDYPGAVLMVSHDFYTIVNCADYVLLVDDTSVRRVRIRTFRKMVYDKHFDKDYLEKEQKKKDLERRIEIALKNNDVKTAKKLFETAVEL